MTTDYIFYVIYETITNFDIITIEDFIIFCDFYQNFYPMNVKIFVILLLTFLLI